MGLDADAALKALLADAYGHLAEGSATEIARAHMLGKIRAALGWPDVAAEAARKTEELQNWANA